jgi:hypothetical protein
LQAQHTSGDATAEKREASPFIMQKKGEPMTEKRTPDFTFAQRLGNTNFKVNVFCKDDSDVTYTDKLLELIRSGMLPKPDEQEKRQDEHAA